MTVKIHTPVGKLKRRANLRDRDFKRPFVLSRANVRSFMAKHIFYEAKFVFDYRSGQLALGETHWKHKDIAGNKFGNSDKAGKCGAFILISKEEGELVIHLAGRSTHFDKPTEKDMQIVTEYIYDLLDALGIFAYRTKRTDAGTVLIYANYPDSFPQACYAPVRSIDKLVLKTS